MKTTLSLKACLLLLLCCVCGAAAGFLNGLMGTGAGIVFLFLSRALNGEFSKDAFAFSMACVIPISAFSLFTYRMPAEFSSVVLIVALFTAAAGGVGGAFLQQKLKISALKKIFAALTVYSGIRMLLK